ncbi:MAG: 3-oxoadipyl-CoA thiolase [Pseudomonadota bacterium]
MQPVYICDAVRTPIGRFGGALAHVRADDLAAIPLRALMQRQAAAVDPERIDELVYGCANQAGEDNRNVARMASLLAGLPPSVPAITVNRLCASGMDAVAMAARTIACGEARLAIAGGVESMSRAPLVMPKADAAFSRRAEIFDTTIGWRFVNPRIQREYGIDSMPETGENVAEQCQVSREDQDAFALRSQQRAAQAQASGRLAAEITPVEIPQRKGDPLRVTRDEHPRADTTLEALARLKTPFRANGTVTAGNASGVNDGACAVLLASEEAVREHDLTPMARFAGAASAGIEPRVMGLGPVPATRRLLTRLDQPLDGVDMIELNEAFAAQGLAVLRELGVDDNDPRVNPNGGAIALGHPLGMTGARLVATAAHSIQRGEATRALATMCVGVGQGVASLLERP